MIRERATISLGGVTLYAESERTLKRGFDRLSDAIVRGLDAHASLDRRLLLNAVARDLDDWLDQRVFGAVLGGQLRLGRVESIPCASINDKAFRVYVSADGCVTFLHRVEEVRTWLQEVRALKVRDVQSRYFPNGGWGTWSCAAHILARVVLIGSAQYIDKYSFTWPDGLENAVR
jgi:hypothetical protein